ncbi:MAG: colicin V production protein [Acidobacteria bacterium]|nr:MAG: colicin V production protein [Acidobacteriota bacterium]
MNIADWIILLVLLVSVVQAASSGFFQEIFGIAGLVFGYLIAAWQYRHLADHFATYISSRWLGEIAAFLAIFLGVMVLAGVLGKIVRWAMKEAGLSVIDRFLGGILGLVRGCLLIAIVLVGMTAFTPTSRWLQNASLSPYFLVVGRAAIWVAPTELRSQFYKGLDYLRKAQASEHSQGK